MSPQENDYAEALRCIQKAENTGASFLNLSDLKSLEQLPRELAGLRALQRLDVRWCKQLSGDLRPPAGLPALQVLNLGT